MLCWFRFWFSCVSHRRQNNFCCMSTNWGYWFNLHGLAFEMKLKLRFVEETRISCSIVFLFFLLYLYIIIIICAMTNKHSIFFFYVDFLPAVWAAFHLPEFGSPGDSDQHLGALRSKNPFPSPSGVHVKERGEGGNHRCVVCERRHYDYVRDHPGVTEGSNPFKRRKTWFRCSACQVYLCVKEGRPCWSAWHDERWRGRKEAEAVALVPPAT